MNPEQYHLVYKTSTTPFFPSCLVGKIFSGKFEKLIGLGIKPAKVIVIIIDGSKHWFFDRKLEKTAIKVFDYIFSRPKYIQKIREKEKEVSLILLQTIKTPISQLFIGKRLNKNGEMKLRQLFSLISSYAQIVDGPGFLFQVYLTDKLRKEIYDKLNLPNDKKEEIFHYSISSVRKTNYEKFLFEISGALENKKAQKEIADEFYWLIHDYLGHIIDENYVKKKMNEFRRDRKSLQQHLNGSLERISKIKRLNKELPKELLQKVNMIQELLFLYNERKKEVLNKVNVYIRKVMEYKLGRISISKLKNICQLSPDEIIHYLKGYSIQDIEKRNRRWAYLIENEAISNAPDDYFILVSSQGEAKELKGLPASPGNVKGRVSIILNISHIHKFKDGDILVAPYTNVNYLPIMSKAKAILTETGGITSHAAIVSRELKKPCIVGIKHLLLMLKDGDFVEVNANHGTIKILG
ncbi:hypothetical protein J4458_04540 [Candidatus Woesearchaeota archaeon]|nr:hypothetical protein [Candidatus Woesearchaeota archaeon]